MKVTNNKTGKDITGLYLQRMKGELTMEEFEELAGFTPEDRQFDPDKVELPLYKTKKERLTSHEIEPCLSDILTDCVVGGWWKIKSNGYTHVDDEMILETMERILVYFKEEITLEEREDILKKLKGGKE